MIRFACRCKHAFAVEDDLAGGMIQCPVCGRLNDVPTLDDLPNLTADGTYDVEVDLPQDNPYRLAELNLIYAKSRRDAEGDEIDLRISMDQFDAPSGAAAAQDDDPLDVIPLKDDEPAAKPSPPRYDPETGELIRPLELKTDGEGEHPHPSTIPIAKLAPTLPYASRGISPGRSRLTIELLMPANAIVLFVVFVLHIGYQILALFPARILTVVGVPLWVLFIPLAMIYLAHYGNVIEDSGPAEYDDLQRPLRDFDLVDDIWWPLTRMLFVLFLCYGPSYVLLRGAGGGSELAALAALAFAALGTLLYPAMALTVMTSGSLLNLRPDRLLGVMLASPLGYLVTVVLWVIAAPLTVLTIFGSKWLRSIDPGLADALGHPLLFVPLIAVAIYTGHLFYAHLGRTWRSLHDRFPWVLQ